MNRKRISLRIAAVFAGMTILATTAPAMVEIRDIIGEVDIMSRVLETRLQQELPGDLVSGGIFERGGVRGAWVPGLGAIFQIKVKFPVAERKPPEEPAEPDKDDLWSQIERGGQSGAPGGMGGFRVGPTEMALLQSLGGGTNYVDPMLGALEIPVVLSDEDRRKIGKLEDIVVETLAKYAERMSHFGHDDELIVLVSGSHDVRSVPNVVMHRTGQPGGDVYSVEIDQPVPAAGVSQKDADRMKRDLDKYIKEIQKSSDPDKIREMAEKLAELSRQSWTTPVQTPRSKINVLGPQVVLTGSRAPATSWVLRVRKADCLSGDEDLRKKAEIKAY